MSEASSAPELLEPERDDTVAEPARRNDRRWLFGISLTTVLNLALTATAFGGLWLQGSSVELERDTAVTDQLTGAAELIKDDDVTVQAAGFRTLERVAEVSPLDQGHVVDLAESFLTAESYKPDDEKSVAKLITGYDGTEAAHVPNPAIQAAVDVIRTRELERDPEEIGAHRVFHLSGMVAEAVRFRDVVMREAEAEACYGAYSVWNRATLRGSDFSQCGFRYARFDHSDLRRAHLDMTDLRRTDFTGTVLVDAHFDEAFFSPGTTFRGADLEGATFAGADLAGMDFSGVKSIADADFSQATGVERTRGLLNAPGHDDAHWPPDCEMCGGG